MSGKSGATKQIEFVAKDVSQVAKEQAFSTSYPRPHSLILMKDENGDAAFVKNLTHRGRCKNLFLVEGRIGEF